MVAAESFPGAVAVERRIVSRTVPVRKYVPDATSGDAP